MKKGIWLKAGAAALVLAVFGGALFYRYRNVPRMGMVRHRVSETIDALVHAVMGGEPLEPVRARLVMPRWRYERLSGSNRLGDELGERGRA